MLFYLFLLSTFLLLSRRQNVFNTLISKGLNRSQRPTAHSPITTPPPPPTKKKNTKKQQTFQISSVSKCNFELHYMTSTQTDRFRYSVNVGFSSHVTIMKIHVNIYPSIENPDKTDLGLHCLSNYQHHYSTH